MTISVRDQFNYLLEFDEADDFQIADDSTLTVFDGDGHPLAVFNGRHWVIVVNGPYSGSDAAQ